MAARSDVADHVGDVLVEGDLGVGECAAIGHVPRRHRLVIRKLGPQLRFEAVHAERDVSVERLAVLGADNDAVAVGDDVGDRHPGAQVRARLSGRPDQGLVQVAAMGDEVGPAVVFAEILAEADRGQHLSRERVAEHQIVRQHTPGQDVVKDSPRVQNPRSVRSDLQAGATSPNSGARSSSVTPTPFLARASALAAPPIPPPAMTTREFSRPFTHPSVSA